MENVENRLGRRKKKPGSLLSQKNTCCLKRRDVGQASFDFNHDHNKNSGDAEIGGCAPAEAVLAGREHLLQALHGVGESAHARSLLLPDMWGSAVVKGL